MTEPRSSFGILSLAAVALLGAAWPAPHARLPVRPVAQPLPNVSHAAGVQEKVLYSFLGGSDGEYPEARLMRDPAGNLFGLTYEGGSTCNCGTIYKMTPKGAAFTESVVYAFGGPGDGKYPVARLFEDKAGNFYGSTELGGFWNVGEAFEMSPAGSSGYTVTAIHHFTGGQGDGAQPEAPLIGDSAGHLYGTTAAGGTNACNCGTVFEISPFSSYNVLFEFSAGSDGATPVAPLLIDGSGALYGTTQTGGGGYSACSNGCGTVFKLTAGEGWHETILYKFLGNGDGALPADGLLIDKHGAIYGTTQSGGFACGGSSGCGTVFKLTPSGGHYTERIIHSFASNGDGAQPIGNLVVDKHGVLYGTTTKSYGLNSCDCGVVFSLTQSGSAYQETILHVFSGASGDGATPYAGLVLQQPTKTLYGTTLYGGSANLGTIFRLKL